MRARPVYNERAWAVEVIGEINRLSATRTRTIRSAGGEWGLPSDGGPTLFPDVLLFGDMARQAVLQGWELKMPDTPVTDSALLDNAEQKSRRLGTSSFLVWNGVDAVLYRIDGPTRVVECRWRTDGIVERADVESNRPAWLSCLAEILSDLDDFFEGRSAPTMKPLPSQLGEVVIAFIQEWQGRQAELLSRHARASRRWRAIVADWWRGVRCEHGSNASLSKPDYALLAAELLLHWIHRFLFGHYLRRYFTVAERLVGLSSNVTSDEVETIFRELSERHDFAHVFKSRPGAELLSRGAWEAMLAFNALLRSIGFAEISQVLLQETMQAIRRESQRKVAGQFCTPSELARLLVAMTIDDLNAPVWDPCCGTGTIARAVLDHKIAYGVAPCDAIRTTWASDKYAMPVQFTTLALACGEAPFETLRVFQSDVLDLYPDRRVPFVNAQTGGAFEERLPAFASLVFNPPFVRSEDWNRRNPTVSAVFRSVRDQSGVDLDAKSDYIVPIVFHLARFCAPGARLGMIVTNAWLGADWGRTFRLAFTRYFALETIITSGRGRWFSNADIVANVIIARRRETDGWPPHEMTRFVVTEKPMGEWPVAMSDMQAEMAGEPTTRAETVRCANMGREAITRIDELGLCWTACFADCGWLETANRQLLPITACFDVARGERRGWDPFFFPPADTVIEREYLLPVLKTAASVKRFHARADGHAFCCERSLEELGRLGHRHALDWIGRFAAATNEKGRPLPEVLKRGGLRWYEMKAATTADLVVSVNPGRRLFFARLEPRAFVNQRLIRLTAKSGVNVSLAHALLCSMIGCFFIEGLGFGSGLGALDLNAGKVRRARMLDPSRPTTDASARILDAFSILARRDLLSLEVELECEDRLRFERAVLEAFGYGTYFDRIKQSLLTMFRIRAAACEDC